MSEQLQEIRNLALRLPREDRAALVELLLRSMESDLSPEWHREIEARLGAWQRGEVAPIDGAEVFAQARRPGL